MEKLLIIADDFTGALDTGIQFAAYGARTEIMTDTDMEFGDYPSAEVFIVDTETRHLPGPEAYDVVYRLARKAREAGITYLYKKTDSGLRGNIAQEIKAVLDASEESFLAFLPAFPEMHRIVKNGVSYIDGIPITESVFGQDPFEPVTCSRVKKLFEEYQNIVREYRCPEELEINRGEKQIAIFDASSDDDLKRTAEILQEKGRLRVLAGCAGFASAVTEYLPVFRHERKKETVRKPLLIMCGSINDISKKQIAYAKHAGISGITLTLEQQLQQGYLDTLQGKKLIAGIISTCVREGACMIDTQSEMERVNQYLGSQNRTLEEARVDIADRLGEILGEVIKGGLDATIMVIGGDTLIHFIKKVKCRQISLLCELDKGVVYSDMKLQGKHYKVISKSGGFGEEDLLVKLINLTEDKWEKGCGGNGGTILFEDARKCLLR